MRKIILEGQLGQKFGTSHLFCGDTPAEAFRLIQANYPEFRKYLIECHEKDIGFHVEVNNQEVDALECLLPLSEGDIIVTPVVAGSKSGPAKILAALAIVAFVIFLPGSATLLLSGGALGGGTAGALAAAGAWTALGIATNLATAGVMQIMAPDPATDRQEDEGYLFNGDARNIVEGDPVPVLYGELRVPATPISIEVVAGSKYPALATHNTTDNNDVTYEEFLAREEPRTYNEPNYPGEAAFIKWSYASNASFGKSQDILITSVISEGQIQGLVNGASSVYLNNDPGLDPSDSNTSLKGTETKASLTNNSKSGTLNKTNASTATSSEESATQKILVKAAESTTSTVNIEYEQTTEAGWPITYCTGIRLVTSSAFFSTDWVGYTSGVKVRILNSSGVTAYETFISEYTSSTSVLLMYDGYRALPGILQGSSYTIEIDIPKEGSVDDNGDIDLTDNFGGDSGEYEVEVLGTKENPDPGDTIFAAAKYKNFAVQFRTGHLYQEPLKNLAGEGVSNTAITQSLGSAIVGPGNTGQNQYVFTDSALGLSRSQAAEADEVSFLISYGSLINYDEENGERPGKVWYNIEIAFTLDGTTYDSYIKTHDSIRHYGQVSSTYTESESINLEQHRPHGAIGFRVRISRLSDNDKAYEEQLSQPVNNSYTSSTPATIVSATTVLKESLSYPLTAMAKVRINSENFSSLPSITYHCRGMKVLVPSNYVTREESEDGVASYTRDVSTGVIDSGGAYQDWDGNFRAEKVYTNNPAWVFYDIIVNNRYGLGNWLSQSDIDIYTLYRIARYCDQLVPDGKGGYEPRFTTNVYFTKATDAYKVLKDLATTFRGMLYWMDGEVVGIIDQASDAVYNFSSSNVIDGLFSYESTGSKVRPNQIAVSWNNPIANYQKEALLVEDSENIAKTGKIVSQESVAFGATSEGQALRYGRWKLWTAKNQTEIVSFRTAINAAFLRPGDIVNIQDPYRHPPYQTLSGRVSSTGTLSSTTIPLDREITLQADSSYELSVLIEEPGAFLSQTSATISGTTYSAGDLVLGITSELNAGNVLDDFNNPVQMVWKEYTRVETQAVSTSSGSNISSLTVSSAFSTTPNVQTVWVLRRTLTSGGAEVLGSKQEYKILSIAEEDNKNEYSITAVRHYNEKFDAVDNDFTLSIADPVYPPELADDFVPAPENVYLVPQSLDNDSIANDVTLYWDVPKNSDGTEYNKVAGYSISHNISTIKQNPIPISSRVTSVGPYELPPGTYAVSVTTVSVSGKRSKPKKAWVTIEKEITQKQVRRSKGVVLGGSSTSRISLTTDNTFVFSNNNYTFIPAGNPTIEVEGSTGTASTYSQDVSDIPSISAATWAAYTLTEKLYAAHYILIDSSDTSDPIKLVKWYEDSTLGIGYFYDAGTGNTAASSYWAAGAGTVNVTQNSNKVVGSGTSFTSEFKVGDYIRFGTTQVAKISYIYSNTVLFLAKSFSSAITSATVYYPTIRIDRNDDAGIAAVRNVDSTFKLIPLPNFNIIDDPEGDGKAVVLTSNPDAIRFNSSGTLITTHSDITLTARALGFQNPEFKITGAGFSNSEITASAETTFTNNGTNAYSKTLDDITTYDEDGLVFTVTVREKDSTSTTATADLTISMLQDGQDGAAGTSGDNGDRGAQTVTGYLYYQTSSASAPTAPTSSNTYGMNFATGKFGTILSGWSHNPPTFAAGNSNKYWYVFFGVEESGTYDPNTNTYSAETITIDSTATQGIGFTGLVTFSANTLTDGSSTFDPSTKISTGGAASDINNNITTINGGKITTNTLVVDSITSSNWQRTLSTGAVQRFRLGTGTAFNIPALGTINSSIIGWGLTNGSDIVVGNTGLSSNGPGVFGGAYGSGSASYGAVFGHTDDQTLLSDGVTPAFADWHNVVFLGGHTNTQAGYFEGSEYSGGSKTIYNTTKIGTSSTGIEVTGTNTTGIKVVGQGGSTTQIGTSGLGIHIYGTNSDILTSGNVTAYGVVSDIRLKDNIEVIPDALDKVSELRGVTFDYKSDRKRSTGLIAQELQKILPEAVYETNLPDENEEDKVLAIRYGNVVGLLVEAIKELKAEIEELKRGDSN